MRFYEFKTVLNKEQVIEKLLDEASPKELLKLQQGLIDKIQALPIDGEGGEATAAIIDKIEQALRDV